jgi:hypothetical protein
MLRLRNLHHFIDFNVLFILWIALQVPFIVWVAKGKPPASLWTKYSRLTRLHLAVPGRGWRRRFAPEDIAAFENYRNRVFIQWGVTMGTCTLLFVYMYFRFF